MLNNPLACIGIELGDFGMLFEYKIGGGFWVVEEDTYW